jgi:hypothetical protein
VVPHLDVDHGSLMVLDKIGVQAIRKNQFVDRSVG